MCKCRRALNALAVLLTATLFLISAAQLHAKQTTIPDYSGIYSSVMELTYGGTKFELGRVLQILPDGRAVLVSSYNGDRPTVTARLREEHGDLMNGVIDRQRIVHSGTWKLNQGKLDVFLTTIGAGPERERIDSRLTFETRDTDRLVAIRSDVKSYGTEILRLRRVNLSVPIKETPATSVRVRKGANEFEGPLTATIDGKTVTIAEKVRQAWRFRDGFHIVYSVATRSGGFENEGESLFGYDVRTMKTSTLLVAPKIIDMVRESTSASGRLAYVVSLSDGAIGSPMTAICDPDLGEVFRRDSAKFAGMQTTSGKPTGRVILALYKPGAFDGNENPASSGSVTVDLDEVLPAKPKSVSPAPNPTVRP